NEVDLAPGVLQAGIGVSAHGACVRGSSAEGAGCSLSCENIGPLFRGPRCTVSPRGKGMLRGFSVLLVTAAMRDVARAIGRTIAVAPRRGNRSKAGLRGHGRAGSPAEDELARVRTSSGRSSRSSMSGHLRDASGRE